MLSPPTVWRQQSEFVSSRQSGQIPAAVRIGFECRCNVATEWAKTRLQYIVNYCIPTFGPSSISMDTHVGLNVATRVCDIYPDKCWLAVLCRFWLQCHRTLTYTFAGSVTWAHARNAALRPVMTECSCCNRHQNSDQVFVPKSAMRYMYDVLQSLLLFYWYYPPSSRFETTSPKLFMCYLSVTF